MMSWLLTATRLLTAVKLPMQAAVLTYVGAAGLSGAVVVGGVMVTPAREVVEQAIEPAREFVQTRVPSNVCRHS